VFKNLMAQFLKKAIYAAIGIGAAMLIDFINAGLAHYQPKGEIQDVLWALLAAALTGLVALLNRLRTWDPGKALGLPVAPAPPEIPPTHRVPR
jgi:hypothetical protein